MDRRAAAAGVQAIVAVLLVACVAGPAPTPSGETPPGTSVSPAATDGSGFSSPLPVGPTVSPTPRLTAPATLPTQRPSVAPSAAEPSATPAAPVGPPPTPPSSWPVPSLPAGAGVPVIFHGSRSVPVVALTIDDGWNTSAVLSMLATLQREHVNATFVPYASTVAGNPAVWQRVANAGFPLANHTYSHAYLTRLGYSAIVTEITRATSTMATVTGRAPLPLLRPPGGNYNDTVLRAASAAGMRAAVNWDTSFGDTGRGSVEQLIANGTRGQNGSIVLMHALSTSAQALPAVIASYRARGFAFVTLGQMLGVGGPVPYPPASPPTPTPRPTVVPSPTPMPVATPTPTPRPSPTPALTRTPAPTASVSPTSSPSPTPSPSPSSSPQTPTPTASPG